MNESLFMRLRRTFLYLNTNSLSVILRLFMFIHQVLRFSLLAEVSHFPYSSLAPHKNSMVGSEPFDRTVINFN